ncbi:MAG: UDP-N-acetylglucosamine 2-epimerase (non-hydrolyzing) [Planctomycetota bacterium]
MTAAGRFRTLCVFGTRPEAIKMAPVVGRLAADPRFDARVCVTGQHREMLAQVLDVFDVVPDRNLDVMRPGQGLHDVTSSVLLGMRDVLDEEQPDVVLVHGDTTTCFAAGLAGFYGSVPVAHVEAGLRTGDMQRPWPEELNRVLVGRLASLHFAPTEAARANLLDEGADDDLVHVTGNTVVDALLDVRRRVEGEPAQTFEDALGADLAGTIDGGDARVVLVTGHRRESFGQGFRDLCTALARTAEAHPDWRIVYPVHLNPNVKGPVHETLGAIENVHLIEPLEYRSFVWLMNRADAIVTDSGGIQEEGPSLRVPILVTRDVTERPEAVECGAVKLVGTDPDRICTALDAAMLDEDVRAAMTTGENPYGDGRAADRIADHLHDYLAARRADREPAPSRPRRAA